MWLLTKHILHHTMHSFERGCIRFESEEILEGLNLSLVKLINKLLEQLPCL
jgi:hypothetical protein